jgi:hypothetical protein
MKYLLLLFCLFTFFSCNPSSSKFEKLLKEHKSKYEFIRVQDVYKLLYQSVFGIKHLLHDTLMSKKYLYEEYNSIEPKDEPLMENISTDGSIIRINLKSFKLRNLSLENLFEIMKISADSINGENGQFEKYWKEFNEYIIKEDINFKKGEFDAFPYRVGDSKKEMHHSVIYVEKYKPSYRVVKKDIFLKYFPEQK